MTVTVGDGSAEVTVGTETLTCSATSDYPGIAIDCDLPTGDQLRITLEVPCPSFEGGVTAWVEVLLVHVGDAAPGSLDDPPCQSLYDAS